MRTLSPSASAPPPSSQLTEMPSDTSDSSQRHVPRATDGDATHHQALKITEILENILVHLPIKELFVDQRVSKRFRETIAGSPTMRKKMLLTLPDTPREFWTIVRRQGAWRFTCVDGANYIGNWLTTPVTLNQALRVSSSANCIQRKRQTRWHNEYLSLTAPAQSVGSQSSLLATYISDPPCKLAVFRATFMILGTPLTMLPGDQPHSIRTFFMNVRSETGLRLEDLWNAALDGPGGYRWKDQYGVMRERDEPILRKVLEKLKNPSIILNMAAYNIQLVDVVVPTAEEWAAV